MEQHITINDKIKCPTLVLADKKDRVFGHDPSMEIIDRVIIQKIKAFKINRKV